MATEAVTSIREIQKRLISNAGRAWQPLSLGIMAAFLGGVLIVIQARLVSQTIASVFIDRQSLLMVSSALAFLLAVIMGRAVLTLVGEVASRKAARAIKQTLQSDLIDRLFFLGPAYIRKNESGELINTLASGIEALDAYFSQYLPQLVLVVLVPVTILVAVFPLDRLSGLVLLFTAPLIPIFMVLIGSQAEALTRRQWGELGRLAAHFLDTLQGLATLKALGRSQDRTASIATASDNYRRRTMEVLRVTFLSALVLELVGTISTAVVAVEIGLRLLNGGMDYRQALFILILAPEFYLPLRNLGLRFHASAAGVSTARRIFGILSDPTIRSEVAAVRSAGEPYLDKGATYLPRDIVFNSISYSYPGMVSFALRDLTFTLPAGKRVALVGASGAGKTTLLQLLLRFIEPTSGQMLLESLPFNSLNPGDWRRLVAWVPQRPYLFNDTIRANLCLGRERIEEHEIKSVLDWAHLDEFVASLPGGLDTRVGENGMRLSGGQAQRLALARAYLKNCPYLLLDEPGANLDPEQEAFMTSALEQLSQGRTVVTVAHRLSTVRSADLILVLENGRLVESGAHQALIAQGGVYAKLLSSDKRSMGEIES